MSILHITPQRKQPNQLLVERPLAAQLEERPLKVRRAVPQQEQLHQLQMQPQLQQPRQDSPATHAQRQEHHSPVQIVQPQEARPQQQVEQEHGVRIQHPRHPVIFLVNHVRPSELLVEHLNGVNV